MSLFKNISIRNKLILIQVATAFIAVLTCCAFFLYNDIKIFKASEVKNKYSIAEVIGVNLISPLLFNDQDAANKILSNLKSNPDILNIAVLDKTGKRFADYTKKGESNFSFPTTIEKSGAIPKLLEQKFIVIYSIFQEKEFVGTLLINAESKDMNSIIYSYIKGTIFVLIAGIFVAIVISVFLQRTISSRLLALVSKTKMVSQTNNYSIRVPAAEKDEIGVLSGEFNIMLEQTENTQKALKETNENLELRVKERTIKLEESEKQFRHLIEHAPDAIITIDEEGKITAWNAEAETTFGWKAAEVKGKTLTQTIIPEKFREAHKKGMAHFLATKEGTVLNKPIELLGLRKNNDKFPLDLKISVSKMNDKYVFIGFIRDITERKKNEADLKLKSEELIRSNKELEQFAYVASHDLQEPLRTISNYVGLLEEKCSETKDEDILQYIRFTVSATLRMQTLIKDLLEFSRVGRNPIFILVDCNKILKEVMDEMDASIKESNAKITYSILPVLEGIEIELKRLFQNLISNAIKFRKKNSAPEIVINVENKANEYLFSIKDNGIGIEEQYFKKLFIIFQRLHSAEEYPGTGMGLATCKKIVDLHNGKIWIESKLNEGSTFYFTIPKNNLKNKFNLKADNL